jgi:hypothetical protein
MNDLAKEIVFLVPIVLIIYTAIVIIASFDYRLKKQLLNSNRTDLDISKILAKKPHSGTELLKWGLIALFGGIGLVVLEFIPYNLKSSSLPYGVEAIFLSIGFLTYYFLVKKKEPTNLD